MSVMSVLRLLSDRTAVLFLGVGAGVAIGYAFAGDIARVTGAEQASLSTRAPAASTAKSAEKLLERAVPFQPRMLSVVASGSKIRVGVFGDSFGDGLWAALYHQLPARESFQVIKFSRQSTGFTRYGSLNLETHLADQMVGQPIDIAVISFGANDTQGVMHKGRYAALLSPGWKEEIGARIERYVGMLRKHGAVVFWVGLPVMRKASFDADISGMNAFYAATMARLGVPFIDTRPMSVDEKGQYAAYLPDPVTHVPRLARANDGIHMSMRGYERLTVGLAGRIRAYVTDARKQALADGTSARMPAMLDVAAPASEPEVRAAKARAVEAKPASEGVAAPPKPTPKPTPEPVPEPLPAPSTPSETPTPETGA